MISENTITITDAGIKAIREDADLYASVSKALEVRPAYLNILLRNKDPRLTQMNILRMISELSGITIEDLVSASIDDTSD